MNFKKKSLIGLLGLALVAAGCSSPKDDKTSSASQTSSQISESNVSQLDAKMNGQSILEVPVLKNIDLAEGQFPGVHHVFNDELYFTVNDPIIEKQYPTVREYKYNLNTDELSVVKERDSASGVVVMDFIEYNGTLYESTWQLDEDGQLGSIKVYAGDTLLWESKSAAMDSIPHFLTVDGSLYVLLSGYSDGAITESLQKINGSTMDLLWSHSSDLPEGTIKNPGLEQGNPNCYAFLTDDGNGQKLNVLYKDQVNTMDAPGQIDSLVMMGDSVMINSVNAEDPTQMDHELLNASTMELTLLNTGAPGIGQARAGAGTPSNFLYRNQEGQTALAVLNGDTLNSVAIDGLPAGEEFSYVNCAGGIDLIAINTMHGEESEGNPIGAHFVLVNTDAISGSSSAPADASSEGSDQADNQSSEQTENGENSEETQNSEAADDQTSDEAAPADNGGDASDAA